MDSLPLKTPHMNPSLIWVILHRKEKQRTIPPVSPLEKEGTCEYLCMPHLQCRVLLKSKKKKKERKQNKCKNKGDRPASLWRVLFSFLFFFLRFGHLIFALPVLSLSDIFPQQVSCLLQCGFIQSVLIPRTVISV